MKDLLFAVLAAVSAIAAVYFLYSFQTSVGASSNSLYLGIVFAILAVVFGGLFAFGRVNQHEDIHITE